MPGSAQLPESTSSRKPVRYIPGDAARAPQEGMALCLSGGGFRAMLFHLGALWRLGEAGMLPRLERISSVSGGSITSAALGVAWSRLDFDARGAARGFAEQVVAPIRRLARTTLDWRAVLGGLFTPTLIGRRLARAYRSRLLADATLQDLPDRPRFVFNATNLQTGVLWRFEKPYMADYRVGMIRRPRTPLALAVAASSAFPPVLSPVILHVDPSDFIPGSGLDLQREPFVSKVVLTDGGVYDNLGLETAWKRYRTILVSDAGGLFEAEPRPWRNWILQSVRVLFTIDHQVRSLRIRQLMDALKDTEDEHDGAYWGIGANIREYGLPDALPCDPQRTAELAAVPTRLKRLPETLQERLINWGYAICDASMRRYLSSGLPPPEQFPYPCGV